MPNEPGNPDPAGSEDSSNRRVAFFRLFTSGIVVGYAGLWVAAMIDRGGDLAQAAFGFLVLAFIFAPAVLVYALLCFFLSRVWQPQSWAPAFICGIGCVVLALAVTGVFGLGLRIH